MTPVGLSVTHLAVKVSLTTLTDLSVISAIWRHSGSVPENNRVRGHHWTEDLWTRGPRTIALGSGFASNQDWYVSVHTSVLARPRQYSPSAVIFLRPVRAVGLPTHNPIAILSIALVVDNLGGLNEKIDAPKTPPATFFNRIGTDRLPRTHSPPLWR